MSPDQINTWADAALRVQNMADVYGPGLILASSLVTGWWTCRWICRRAFHIYDWARERRDLRSTPAAFDNQPPVDDELLIACRRIDRQPPTDPDDARRAINYLRDQAGEETP